MSGSLQLKAHFRKLSLGDWIANPVRAEQKEDQTTKHNPSYMSPNVSSVTPGTHPTIRNIQEEECTLANRPGHFMNAQKNI